MGKRKIGEIYNKPIVEGDKNLVTNNEIHKSELSGGSGSGGNYEYLDLREVDALDSEYAILGSVAQVLNIDAEIAGQRVSAVLTGASAGAQMKYITKIKCAAIDFSIKSEVQIGTLKTAKEWALMFLTQQQIDSIPRLTKEEFYSLD